MTKWAMGEAALANVIFGLSFLFTKRALGAASPIVLLAYRFTLAAVLMSVIALMRRDLLRLKGKPIGSLILLGFCQPVLYFICENYGILYVSTTFAAVMLALVPIAAMLLGMVFLREVPKIGQAICSIVSVGGVIFLALKSNAEGTVTGWGIVLLIGAVFSAAFFNLLSRKTAASFSAFERTFMMFLLAAVVFDLWAVIECGGVNKTLLAPLFSSSFRIGILYLGGVSSVGAFLLYNSATTYLTVARATAFSNVITVVSLLAGAFFLHEPLALSSWIASAVIVLGVWGAQRKW